MAIDIWERQQDLLTLKLQQVRKDLPHARQLVLDCDRISNITETERDQLRQRSQNIVIHMEELETRYVRQIEEVKARR